jgi:hypothetical protein
LVEYLLLVELVLVPDVDSDHQLRQSSPTQSLYPYK